MERLKFNKNVTIAWRSFELRPAGSPPMPLEYRLRIEANQPRFNQIAHEIYGLEINRGRIGLSSRLALTGAKYAESAGRGDAYHTAIFRAYWLNAQSIDDQLVLAELAQTIGLEKNIFLTALDDPKYTAQVDLDVEQANQHGLNGVPALVFNQKYLVSGAQPYDVLRSIVERIETGEIEKR